MKTKKVSSKLCIASTFALLTMMAFSSCKHKKDEEIPVERGIPVNKDVPPPTSPGAPTDKLPTVPVASGPSSPVQEAPLKPLPEVPVKPENELKNKCFLCDLDNESLNNHEQLINKKVKFIYYKIKHSLTLQKDYWMQLSCPSANEFYVLMTEQTKTGTKVLMTARAMSRKLRIEKRYDARAKSLLWVEKSNFKILGSSAAGIDSFVAGNSSKFRMLQYLTTDQISTDYDKVDVVTNASLKTDKNKKAMLISEALIPTITLSMPSGGFNADSSTCFIEKEPYKILSSTSALLSLFNLESKAEFETILKSIYVKLEK